MQLLGQQFCCPLKLGMSPEQPVGDTQLMVPGSDPSGFPRIGP